MRTIITILFSLSLLACTAQVNYRHLNTIQGTSKYTIEKDDKFEMWLEYPLYKVLLERKPNKGGEKIIVVYCLESDTILSIEAGPIYFYGINKNYMFIDQGTGAMRGIVIFNLNSQRFIFSSTLSSPPILKSDSLFFNYPIPQSHNYPMSFPECPDSMKKYGLYGYSEERIFMLSNYELIKTGKFNCEYRE